MPLSTKGKNVSNLSSSDMLSLKMLECDRKIVNNEADKGSVALVRKLVMGITQIVSLEFKNYCYPVSKSIAVQKNALVRYSW